MGCWTAGLLTAGCRMNLTADALKKLHRIHGELTDVRERMGRGPKQLAAANSNLENLQQTRDAAQESLKQARMASDQKQLQLKSAEDHIADLKRKRNECSTNKEYQALIEQIAADEMATSVLSDEILEIMEKIDGLQTAVNDSQVKLDKATDEFQKLQQRIDGERQSLELEAARLTGELTDAEKELPKDFKVEYDRVVKARGDDALTAVEGEVCGGCFQMITPQMVSDLRMARPVFCKSCGRLLYLAEEE